MLKHYQAQDEGTRLTHSGHGRLKVLRTRELLARYLPTERLLQSALLCARALAEDAALLPENAHLLAVEQAPRPAE